MAFTRSLEGNFLDLSHMRSLPVTDEERKLLIIKRRNWYMFCTPGLRGEAFDSSHDLRQTYLETTDFNYPPEQEQPNQHLANNPPPESFFAKYYRAIPEGSRFWHETRDTVSAYDIQQTLTDSWVRWCTISATARRLESAIDKIPDPKRTNKVVCLGLGRILLPLVEPDVAEWGPNNMLASRNLSQHLAAIAITKLLENKTGQQIALYAADPDYKAQHKSALETLSLQRFTVLDPSYGKHEVFTIIDDSTLLFDMAGGPPCPTLSLVQEYARPVAIITHEVPRDGVKYQDRQWFELTERDGTKVQVPGYGVDLLSPHGWDIEDGHFPRRVRDMLVDEYEMEKEFPAGEKDTLPFKLNDLANPEERHQGNAKHSVYWRPGLRLYVRKY